MIQENDITVKPLFNSKLNHLNNVQHTTRNIYQLLIKEKDRDKLISRFCELLCETGCYTSGWLILLDENLKPSASAQTGFGNGFSLLINQMENQTFNECGRQALKQSGAVTIDNTKCSCRDCPLAEEKQDLITLTIRLEYEGHISGLLSVNIPAHIALDGKEQELLEEVAGDIAFALHINKMEKSRVLLKKREKQQHEYIRLLSETAMRFVEFPQDEDIYTYIGDQLQFFAGADSCVVVNSIDMRKNILTTRAVTGMGKLSEKITGLLGKHPIGMTFSATDENLLYLSDGILHEYKKGLYGILLKTVPRIVCHSLESISGVNKIFTIGFIKDNILFGTAVILLRGRTAEIGNRQIIEAFIKQTSIAVQKRQAEEALRKSEEKFRLLAENSIDCIWKLDTRLRFTYLSPSVEDILGYKPEQLTGAKLSSYFSNKEYLKVGALAVKSITHYKTFSHAVFKTRMLNSKNEEVDLEISSSVLLNSQGKLIGLQGTTRDITEDRKAEHALKESCEKLNRLNSMLRLMCDNLPELIWTKDLQNRFMFANKSCCEKLLGTSDVYEPVGKTDIFFADREIDSHPENPDYHTFGSTCTDSDNTVMETGKMHRSDESGYIKGKFTVINAIKSPFLDENGKLIGTVGCARDVTGEREIENRRKRTENALRESEAKFRTMTSSAQDAIIMIKEDGTVMFWNEAAERTLGYTAGEIMGKDLHKLITPGHSHNGYKSNLSKFKKTGQGKFIGNTLDLRAIRKDGIEIPVELSLSGVMIDGKWCSLGILRDITERKLAEKALRESEEKMRTILDSMPSVVLQLDTDHTILWANRTTLNMKPDATGQLCHKALMGRDIPCKNCSVVKALKTKQIERGTVHHKSLVGTESYWDDLGIPIRDSSGEITSIVNLSRNVTDVRRAEEEKARLEDQFRQAQKMECIGRLAGGVAHDFNNMLGVILGRTELALEKMEPTQPVFTALCEIQKAAEHSVSLANQLLAFSRKQTIAPRVLKVNSIMEGMLQMLHRLIGEDIDLVWLPGKDLWLVNVDPAQVNQVLANLCVNSRDAITDVGRITIETQNSIIDEAHCNNYAGFSPGEYVLLTVSDNGCGMDKATMENLFEPFFTTKEAGHGTGLGLATVYGIVKQNNGFIYVRSEPDQGTAFSIYLPRFSGKEEQLHKKEMLKPDRSCNETILLVEDEPAILEIATMMLERQGYTVLAASTPGEAIRLSREYSGNIHLLMTDVVMPEMNGRDLANNLMSSSPSLKCLFMSGYTANVIAHRGVLESGVNFIQKPFAMQDLAVKVHEALESE